MRLVLAVLCILGALTMASCQQVFTVNPKFNLSGKIQDTLGNGIQITSEQNLFLCVDFDYVITTTQGEQLALARAKDHCVQIVSDGHGNYSASKVASVQPPKGSTTDKVVISGLEPYGKIVTGGVTYLLPAIVEDIKVDANGGSVVAHIPILRKLR